ncbi:hypothetical protein SAICODRAFT_73962 [Saitoella complicata NRRL Y-17804]|uniref:uncharacterized protein n=1 Tax=Saitoella complicata (strain BCRC 22490 / CBS 7301 / JCM 7358 / NBRC 10748 / NRRL Y-17804) TaxID=698492 RepID=UPI0008676785|nr:uncharacterized protein SAICODRAFT_73962 [Saitoella complicata NRRL Y-17804]ODQ49807.1 hypothetical protein SAICODRAFT_73962 [Saitoella complicata NRRL Y-17804]
MYNSLLETRPPLTPYFHDHITPSYLQSHSFLIQYLIPLHNDDPRTAPPPPPPRPRHKPSQRGGSDDRGIHRHSPRLHLDSDVHAWRYRRRLDDCNSERALARRGGLICGLRALPFHHYNLQFNSIIAFVFLVVSISVRRRGHDLQELNRNRLRPQRSHRHHYPNRECRRRCERVWRSGRCGCWCEEAQ